MFVQISLWYHRVVYKSQPASKIRLFLCKVWPATFLASLKSQSCGTHKCLLYKKLWLLKTLNRNLCIVDNVWYKDIKRMCAFCSVIKTLTELLGKCQCTYCSNLELPACLRDFNWYTGFLWVLEILENHGIFSVPWRSFNTPEKTLDFGKSNPKNSGKLLNNWKKQSFLSFIWKGFSVDPLETQ